MLFRSSMAQLGIDHDGLDELDRRFLRIMQENYQGGPVGIEALAATINEETDTLMDVVEPYLLKIGFLNRTPRGRQLTQKSLDYIKMMALHNFQPNAAR